MLLAFLPRLLPLRWTLLQVRLLSQQRLSRQRLPSLEGQMALMDSDLMVERSAAALRPVVSALGLACRRHSVLTLLHLPALDGGDCAPGKHSSKRQLPHSLVGKRLLPEHMVAVHPEHWRLGQPAPPLAPAPAPALVLAPAPLASRSRTNLQRS